MAHGSTVEGSPRRTDTDELSALFRAPIDRRSPSDLRQLAQIKRFLERCGGDTTFRRELTDDLANAPAIAARYGITIDPRHVLPLFSPEQGAIPPDEWRERWPLARLWHDYLADWDAVQKTAPDSGACPEVNPLFDAWRRRQMRRCQGELGSGGDNIVHAILSFELSAGCTMGCWFCGISAERFRGYLPYTPENASFWRETLAEAVGLFGPATQSGFCYWATDPADNPDYASFLDDYFRATGTLPQTTTAAPLKDVALTRRVLAMHDSHGYRRNRFSILNRKLLDRVHATFSADELLEVDLVLQNPEATTPRAFAGRARTHRPATFAAAEEKRTLATATIACVTGFLVNMLDRTIRLVSPVPTSERWPLGYRTFDTATFETPGDFRHAVQSMIDRHMPAAPRPADRLRFRDDLDYAPTADGFTLSAQETRFTLKGQAGAVMLGETIRRGVSSAAEVRAALIGDGVDIFVATRLLQQLFDRGLLSDP